LLLDKPDKDGFTPVNLAIHLDNYHVFKELIKAGFDIKTRDKRVKRTPLTYTLSHGSGASYYVVRDLIKRGINLLEKDGYGENFLDVVMKNKYDNGIALSEIFDELNKN
jgi:ankyrin repeat protein